MSKPKVSQKKKSKSPSESLMVRLDEDSKKCLAKAADLRHISVSDYVRTVTIPQARREVLAAQAGVVAMTPEEQLAFWNALNATPQITPSQQRLSAIMRGIG